MQCIHMRKAAGLVQQGKWVTCEILKIPPSNVEGCSVQALGKQKGANRGMWVVAQR